MVERAVRTDGLLEEDRVAILEQAYELASGVADRYDNNKNVLSACAELGIEYYKKTGRLQYFDEAIDKLQIAEERLGDPDISKIIGRFNRRLAGQSVPDIEPEPELNSERASIQGE